jgi:hypothetical protein
MVELATQNKFGGLEQTATLASNIASGDAVMSKANNMVQLNHVASILSSVPMAQDASSIGYNPNDILYTAASIVSDGTTENIPFFSHLKAVTGTMMDPSAFSYNDLLQIDASADAKTTVFTTDGGMAITQSNINILNTADFANIASPTYPAMIASTISEELAGLLMQNMLTRITISATNMVPNGESVIQVLGGNSVIQELDTTIMMERVKASFGLLIFNRLTMNGTVGLSLMIDIDIYGDCLVSVELEGDYQYTFNIPTYADNLSTSMVMDNQSYANGLRAYDGLLSLVTN